MAAADVRELIERLQKLADVWGNGRYGDKTLRLRAEATATDLREAVSALLSLAEERETLKAALKVIHVATRGDEHSEAWSIRKWLDDRGVFNDDIQGTKRLVEAVCAFALDGSELLPRLKTEALPQLPQPPAPLTPTE